MLPTARHRCDISSKKTVLPGRNDAEISPANLLFASAFNSEYNERFDTLGKNNAYIKFRGQRFLAGGRLAEVESSRTHFEVLGLGLEASSPRKLACPRLEDSSIFWIVKILCCGALEKSFGKRFFVEIAWKIFVKTFFFGEHLRLCPWPWAFLSLASRVSILGKAGLGLGFFLCPLALALASSLESSTPPLQISIQKIWKYF